MSVTLEKAAAGWMGSEGFPVASEHMSFFRDLLQGPYDNTNRYH
jgi:hypothetical protein